MLGGPVSFLTMPGNRLGIWSAVAVFLIGIAYFVTLTIGFAVHGLTEPIVDPILAIMEVLTLMSALSMVVIMAAVHGYASVNRKIYSSIALAFTILFAGTTSAVHFVELTALRQVGSAGIVWPSPQYAVELLAWNLFLGLALLFASPVFDGVGPERGVRRGLLIRRSLRRRYRRACSRKHAASTSRRTRLRGGAPGRLLHAGQAISQRSRQSSQSGRLAMRWSCRAASVGGGFAGSIGIVRSLSRAMPNIPSITVVVRKGAEARMSQLERQSFSESAFTLTAALDDLRCFRRIESLRSQANRNHPYERGST